MKSHDWIFLMFTTIICCTTIITIAQAQQRGRVKFGVSMQKDEVDTNNSPEIVSLANQARGSASHRASSRFRAAIPSAIPLTLEENKEPSRSVQRGGTRGRANDRSSRKLTAEATEAIPLVRSRKRINPVPTASTSADQPTKIELPTSSIDRTNVIRRSKTRSESASPSPSSTLSPPTPSASIRRRSDVPSEGPSSTEGVRKVRTFTSRSVTKQADEVISSENPLTVATTGSNWRNVVIKRGTSKVKSSERKSKALEVDQLEDENYPEHFKLLLRKQQPSPALLPKNYPKLPIQEDQTYSKLNEIYEAPKAQVGRLRRLEKTSQETSDEILQVSRAIPKVRRVELKREDTARAALKTKRIEPRLEENIESELRIEEPPKSRRSDSEKLRAQVKINKAAIKSRRKEPSNEVQREDIPKVPFKSNRRTAEASTEDNGPEVKPNEIEESSKSSSKPLFLPRRAEPYRPKPKTTTQRPTTTSKPIKKPEVLASRTKFKNRFNSRLQFPSLRTKTSSASDEVIKYDNEVVHTSPAPQPIRPLQITKSRNLALDRPAVDARPKPKQQKFSSRYRGDAFSRYQQKTEPSKPIYTPTIPALTTEPIPPQLDQVTPYNLENQDLNKSGSNFEGIVYDGKAGVWNMVEPVAGGLTRSEISVESVGEEQPLAQSSVTVSIFEALADILSKTPSTTTSTTTTTTTSTTTTELPDIIQVPEQKIDSISSTTVNKHETITDVMDDENTSSTTTNAITNNDRDGRLLNSVEINPSTTIFTPTTTLSIDTSDSLETITVPQYTSSDTTLLFRSIETEQTTPEFIDFTTLSLPALPTQPTLINTNLTNISTNLLELTTLASNPPTSLPMPFLADALTTPGSSLITTPQLISAISNFLDTSVQNASDTMATTATENTTETSTTTATLDTNNTPTDASTTLSPPITTTFSPPSTGSPPVTISFLDLFTIQAKKVNQNTEPALEVHPIYKGPESTTIPVGVEKKQTTGRPVNINTFFGTQTYPSVSITGSTSTDRTLELSSTFSENPKVTGGETTDTPIPSTTTLEQDTSTLDYTTSPQSSIRTQSLPIHLNSILGSTQKYDQTSPFKTVQTEITTTIRSRFGNRRIPILPAGSVQSTTNKISTSTQTSSTTTTPVSTTTRTATQVSPENNQQKQQQLSNVTTTTSSTTSTTTEQKPIQDFSVYGILPNNTVVRKRPPQLSRQLDIGIMVYGILPNQTVVRKYPNGTLMIVDSSKDVEVVDIDPKMLFNPFSELYRTSQSSLLLTTHRSTTSHRLIESNHILSSSSSSSSTEVPNNNSATGSGRRGNSIKETTESGNTDSALSTNTDDENLIQWLSENEDNILNSTILFESNTENAVLLDLLKRKYIKTDLPSRSSNVVSLTTVRNVVEENSIPANREEDVSENTLFDSSEETKKDPIDDFFLSKGSVVPNRINNNNDDENVISKQFDTSYANVGIGSIFAGNKGRKLDNSQRTKLYPINYEMAIQNTTTKLFPIHTFSSSTMHNPVNHAVQEEFLAEVVNRTHGIVVENSIKGFETATPKRDGESKFIDFGILESEVDSEANRDYFMDPEDRLKIVDDGFDFDTDEGSGNSYDGDSELNGFDNTGEYNTKVGLDKPKTDLVDIETSPILDKSINSTVNVSLSGEKADSEASKVDSVTKTILSDFENDGNIESPFIHIVFPEGVFESSDQFSDIYTTVSPLRNTSLLFKSEDLIPSLDKKGKLKTSQKKNLGKIVFTQDSTTLQPNLDKVSGNIDDLLHDTVVSTTTFRSTTSGKDDKLRIDSSNIRLDIENVSIKFSNNFVSDFKNGTLSLLDDENLGLKNESLLHSISDSFSPSNETQSEGFFGSDSKISDDLDSTHSYVFDNSSINNTFNNFALVDSTDDKGFNTTQHSGEDNSGSSLNSNSNSEFEISSSYSLNSSNAFSISDLNKNPSANMASEVPASDVGLNQDNSFFNSLNATSNINENYFQNKPSESTVVNDSLLFEDPKTLLSTYINTNTSSIITTTDSENLTGMSPQDNNSKELTSDTDFKTFEGNSHLISHIDSEISEENKTSKDNSAHRELKLENIPSGITSNLNASLLLHNTKDQSESNLKLIEDVSFDSETIEGNITSSHLNKEKDSERPNEGTPIAENNDSEMTNDRKPMPEIYVDEILKFEDIQAGISTVSNDSIINSDVKDLYLSPENANTYKQDISLNENESSNDVFPHDFHSEVLNTNVGSKTIEENGILHQLTIAQDSKISTEPESFRESSANINFKPETIQPFNQNTLKTPSYDEISSVGSSISHPKTLDEVVGNPEFQNNLTETLPSSTIKVIGSPVRDINSFSLQGLQSTSNSSEIISSMKEFSPEVVLKNEELSSSDHTENKSEGFSIVHDSQIITVTSKFNNSETTDSLSDTSNSSIDSDKFQQMENSLTENSVRTISNEEQVLRTESKKYPERNELNSNIYFNPSYDLNEGKVVLNEFNENVSPSKGEQQISEKTNVNLSENINSINERNKPSDNITPELKNNFTRDSSVGMSIVENEPIRSTVKVETVHDSNLDEQNDLNATKFESDYIKDLNLSSKSYATESSMDLIKNDISTEGFLSSNVEINSSIQVDSSIQNATGFQNLGIGSFVEDLNHQTNIGNGTLFGSEDLNLSKELTYTERTIHSINNIELNSIILASIGKENSSKQIDSFVPNFEVSEKLGMQDSVAYNSTNDSVFDSNNHELKPTVTKEIDQTNDDRITQIRNDIVNDLKVSGGKSSSTENSIELSKDNESNNRPPISNTEVYSSNEVGSIINSNTNNLDINTFSTTSKPFEVTDLIDISSTSSSDITSDIELKVSEKLGDEFYLPTSDNRQNKNEDGIDSETTLGDRILISKNEIPSPDSAVVVGESDKLEIKKDSSANISFANDQFLSRNTSEESYTTLSVNDFSQQFEKHEVSSPNPNMNNDSWNELSEASLKNNLKQFEGSKSKNNLSENIDIDNNITGERILNKSTLQETLIPVINSQNDTKLLESPNLEPLENPKVNVFFYHFNAQSEKPYSISDITTQSGRVDEDLSGQALDKEVNTSNSQENLGELVSPINSNKTNDSQFKFETSIHSEHFDNHNDDSSTISNLSIESERSGNKVPTSLSISNDKFKELSLKLLNFKQSSSEGSSGSNRTQTEISSFKEEFPHNGKFSEYPDLKEENQLVKQSFNSSLSETTNRPQFDMTSVSISQKTENLTENVSKNVYYSSHIPSEDNTIVGEEIVVTSEKTNKNNVNSSPSSESNDPKSFESPTKNEFLYISEKEYPGIVGTEIVHTNIHSSPSVEVSDRYNSPNTDNESIDQNLSKSTNILERPVPSTNQVFENDSNTEEQDLSPNNSEDKNKTSSKEIWTSSISAEIVEKGGLTESQLPNYFSLKNSSFKSKQNYSVQNNGSDDFSPSSALGSAEESVLSNENKTNLYSSENQNGSNTLNFNASISLENENFISNLKPQTIGNPLLFYKINGSSYDGNIAIPAFIKSQFDFVFNIGQELAKTHESLLNKSSEEPINIKNNVSQPIFLDPIIRTLNTSFSSGMTDKDLETDQHVVPRKGALLNSTEELGSPLVENIAPIDLSEIISSSTNSKSENEVSHQNNDGILVSRFSNGRDVSQNFLLPNKSREHSEEALYSYNQIKEVGVETSVSQDNSNISNSMSKPKHLIIETYNDYVPTVSTKDLHITSFETPSTETSINLSTSQEPNLKTSSETSVKNENSHVDALEVQSDQHPVTLSKPPINSILQSSVTPKISITSNDQNELSSSVDVGSEYEAQYSTQIPILQSADQILEQKFETSSVRPVPSRADKDRVSKIILELLNKSEVGSQISGYKSESKNYEEIRTQQNLISEKPVIDAGGVRTSTNFDEEYSESRTGTPKPTQSSLTTKNMFDVSSIPTAYSLVTASSEEFTKPPAVFYPVNSHKFITPLTKHLKAAIVTPTKTHAFFESSTEPDKVSMIFPKDFMPTLNMALPGSLHQTYTKESFHKPVLSLMPSSIKNLHQESQTKQNSNHMKTQKEREFTIPLKPINPPSYVEESSSDRTTPVTTQESKSFVETTTSTLPRDKVPEVPLFVPGGVPIERLSNTDSSKSSKQPIQKTVQSIENKFVPGGVPQDLLVNIRTLPKKNNIPGPVFTAETPLGAIFGHLPSNSIVPVYVPPSSTTVAPLKTIDNTFHKTYQFNLKMLKSTIEKVENDVKVLKETFIKSLNKSTNLIDTIEEKRNRLDSLSNSSKNIQDFLDKSNDFKGFQSESLTKNNIAPIDQLDLLQETLDPALATRNISNTPQNLIANSKFNLQTMMKNSEFKTINSNPVYQMSANALANAQTINSIMSESTADSVSKSNSHPITNNDANKSVFNTNSGQNLYKPVPFSGTPQQLPSSEMNVDSWTKLTPSEVTYYSPVQNIEAHNQKHTETQYTIQQQHMYQESSTLSSLGNSFVIDNLKHSINTIAEPKQVDRQTTPTIYLVTPAPMTTTTEIPITATATSTMPSTTTSTSTTPSSTTTSTTPSTTTTSSTTEATTTSTTTPIATTTTTTSTTTTPIPIIPEITTTPKPTIVFKAPSTTSDTIFNSQSPPQTNTALNDANNSELEKNIKLLEQLLQLQASLKPKTSSSSTTTTSTPSTTTTTTKATEAPTKIISASNAADDEQFINQLRQLLLSQQQATKKPTTSTSTTTTTTTPKPTTTTTRKPITISPQNLQDLLNSFSTPSFTTTTAKPITNVNDIEFLNSLRDIGKIQVTTSAPTTFANRIIELALKNRPVKPTSPVYISTTVPPFVPMPEVKFPQILPSHEVEKHHQDQASLSADLSLLSTLLGRRITIADLPQITQQFGGNRAKPAFAPIPAPRKTTTTTTTTPRTTRKTTTTTSTDRPMTKNEIAEIEKNLNLLSSLLGRPVSLNELPLIMQELRSGRKPKGTASGATINFITPAPFKTTTTVRQKPDVSLPSQTPISQEEVIELLKDPSYGSPEQLNIYGQSNDAILAAVLKQRGIGPAHNNLPINDLFGQEQTQRPYRPTRPPPPPPPQRRPVLDGLAWLWRTWQETAAPGNRVSKNNRQPTASASTRLESPLLVGGFVGGEAPTPTVNSNEGGEYADLQYPQNPSFGQGNGLLTAAFGVTKAVSQFLGAAFQGAAKSVQSAFSPQAIQQPSLISLSG